jgi:hypothetical protein
MLTAAIAALPISFVAPTMTTLAPNVAREQCQWQIYKSDT